MGLVDKCRCGGVAVFGSRRRRHCSRAGSQWVAAQKAQTHTAAANRSFLIRRRVMEMERPEARVAGANPA
jgi:hypothetical protein